MKERCKKLINMREETVPWYYVVVEFLDKNGNQCIMLRNCKLKEKISDRTPGHAVSLPFRKGDKIVFRVRDVYGELRGYKNLAVFTRSINFEVYHTNHIWPM